MIGFWNVYFYIKSMWNQFLLCCLDCNWGRWVLFDTRKLFLPNAISNVLAHLCFKCTYFRFLRMGELLLQLPLYTQHVLLYGHWAGRDLSCATPAVARDLGLPWRPGPICHLIQQASCNKDLFFPQSRQGTALK